MDYRLYHYKDNNFNDIGFGCSYRNIQTILSCYKKHYDNNIRIPDVRELFFYFHTNYEEIIKNGFSMDLWIEPYQISQYLSDKFKINAYNILYHINDNYRQHILNTRIDVYESKTYSKHDIDIVSLLFKRHFERSRLPIVIDDGIYSYCICEIKNDELTISDPHKTNDNEVLIKKPMSFLWESFWMIYFPLNY